jgi:hypothetical protein
MLEKYYSAIYASDTYANILEIHQRFTQDLFSSEVAFMMKLITCDFSVLRKDFIPNEWKNDIKGHEAIYIALATLYSYKYHDNTTR